MATLTAVDNFMCRPASLEAMAHCVVVDSSEPTDFRETHFLATPDNPYRDASVGVIFSARYPLAVFGAIVAVVINAINLVLRCWATAHVGDKCLEGGPSFTNPNPTATVISPRAILGVCASLVHRPPYKVFGRIAFSVAEAPFRCCRAVKAAAAFCMARSKAMSIYDNRFAAFAQALPSRISMPVRVGKLNYRQPAVLLASSVYKPTLCYNAFRHLGLLLSSMKFRGWQGDTCYPRLYIINPSFART